MLGFQYIPGKGNQGNDSLFIALAKKLDYVIFDMLVSAFYNFTAPCPCVKCKTDYTGHFRLLFVGFGQDLIKLIRMNVSWEAVTEFKFFDLRNVLYEIILSSLVERGPDSCKVGVDCYRLVSFGNTCLFKLDNMAFSNVL